MTARTSALRMRATVIAVVVAVSIVVAVAESQGWFDDSRDGAAGVAAGPSQQSETELLALLDTLEVGPWDSMDGYDRSTFPHWRDPDGNSCDARNDVLARDLDAHVVIEDDGCVVTSGVMTVEPYTGVQARSFQRGANNTSFMLDVDHVVSLGNAWVTGAQEWDDEMRLTFANDPANLLAVDARANRQKSALDASEWLPDNEDFWCEFAAIQVTVKAEYSLRVTLDEKDALELALGTC